MKILTCYVEHKAFTEPLIDGPEDITISLLVNNFIKKGDNLSIITFGMGVHWALDYLNQNDVSVDLLDLRTLVPLDLESIGKQS